MLKKIPLYNAIIVGCEFYGCYLALTLQRAEHRVLLVEAKDDFLTWAS